MRRILLFSVLFALGWASGPAATAADESEIIQVPPRTPLFCDDGQLIQPSTWGDFGDFAEAMVLKYGGPYRVEKTHGSGGDVYFAGFGIGHEGLDLYEITPRDGGWALRVVHQMRDGREDVTKKGMDMCGPLWLLLSDRMALKEQDKYMARLKAIAERMAKEKAPSKTTPPK